MGQVGDKLAIGSSSVSTVNTTTKNNSNDTKVKDNEQDKSVFGSTSDNSKAQKYNVKSGDCLWTIAEHYVDADKSDPDYNKKVLDLTNQLKEQNQKENPDRTDAGLIYSGDELTIPVAPKDAKDSAEVPADGLKYSNLIDAVDENGNPFKKTDTAKTFEFSEDYLKQYDANGDGITTPKELQASPFGDFVGLVPTNSDNTENTAAVDKIGMASMLFNIDSSKLDEQGNNPPDGVITQNEIDDYAASLLSAQKEINKYEKQLEESTQNGQDDTNSRRSIQNFQDYINVSYGNTMKQIYEMFKAKDAQLSKAS